MVNYTVRCPEAMDRKDGMKCLEKFLCNHISENRSVREAEHENQTSFP